MSEYIEREKAQDGLDNIDWYHVNDKGQLLPGGRTGIETYVPFKAVEEMLESIPSADVRPVVKAHWTDRRTIEHDGEWYCSACGKEITIYMGADRPDRYRFCPNCGAWMEES